MGAERRTARRSSTPTAQPIPTYDQRTVEGFAHVFTGWTYPLLPGQSAAHAQPEELPRRHGRRSQPNHDTGAKALLDGAIAPAGLAMDADLDQRAAQRLPAIRTSAPFISRQLIQKLVTGDPSPQYVARVAAVFDNNGAGVRGDMKAVVRAILTDPEARGDGEARPGLRQAARARAVS